MRIDVFHHSDDEEREWRERIEAKLDLLLERQEQIITKEKEMSEQLNNLTREVQESRTIAESAITLINGIAQQLRDAADDPAAIQALADELDAQQTALSNAITGNTSRLFPQHAND